MIKNLEVNECAIQLREKLHLFGQFIGNWDLHSTWFLSQNTQVKGFGEVSFGWILYGTAIQDVWTGEAINPPKNFPQKGFGTTIRYFDVLKSEWTCIWIDPVSLVTSIFKAYQKGNEIILEGMNKKGELENWIFSNISKTSFNWRAELSKDNGKNWFIEQKIQAQRNED